MVDLPYLSAQGFRLGSMLLALNDTRVRELEAALTRVSHRKPRTEELSGPADDPLCLLGLILLSKHVTPKFTAMFRIVG
ncbi:hypothetical protein [Nannocystis pusilla]|uniref:hypothetical protein n=1 Tax=Nannocystis pusilla TaxID=889268 RepID=UPI003B7898F2